MKDLEIFFNNIFKLSIKQIIIALGIIVLFYLIDKLLIDKLLKIIYKITKKTHNKIDDNIIKAGKKPIKLLFFGVGVYLALKVINIDLMPSEMLSSAKYLKILVVITICMFVYNITLNNSVLPADSGENTEAGVVFPFIAIVIRLIIIIIAIIIIASEFGLTGFLTGLGVSGIVVALAAQDTCANLFGGMMIVLDKPFTLGDWIKIEGVEGIVEEITFRSTRIRTFTKSLVTVPNSKLTNNNIINCSKREQWRINFKITLDFETSCDQIKMVITDIENSLREKEEIDKNLLIVKFNEISTFGYTIFIYFYTNIIDFYQYESLKEEVNLDILKILNKNNVILSNLNLNIDDIKNEKEITNKEKKKNIKKSIWKNKF